MANLQITLQASLTLSADKYSTGQDFMLYNSFAVYYAVSNGSATAGHLIDLTIQSCDENSSTDADWVDLTPDDGSGFTQITGTGGANPWPQYYIKKFSTFMRWVRGHIDVTNGTWTVEIQSVGRQ